MENLKALRESKKITQSQLGEYLGAKKSAISLWESGKRQPDQETLVRIATFFNVTVDYLLGRDPTTAPVPAKEMTPADRRAEGRKLLEEMSDEEYDRAIAVLKLMNGGKG